MHKMSHKNGGKQELRRARLGVGQVRPDHARAREPPSESNTITHPIECHKNGIHINETPEVSSPIVP